MIQPDRFEVGFQALLGRKWVPAGLQWVHSVTGGLRFSPLLWSGSCCPRWSCGPPLGSRWLSQLVETSNICLSVLGLEQSCNKCATSFKDNDTKHHCRACGEGFCDSCSSKTRPVPERGWGPAPVRVCDNCYEARNVQLGNVGPRGCRMAGALSPWHWLLGSGI